MILGCGGAGFTHGWVEMWMIVYGVCPNHHHLVSGESRTVLIDVYGHVLSPVAAIWLEKSGEANINGTILFVSDSSMRGTFILTAQAEGKWALKIQRAGYTRDLTFDILEAALDANTIAVAVWDKAVGTQAAGSAGKTLANVAGQITAAHTTTDALIASEHTATKTYVDGQITAAHSTTDGNVNTQHTTTKTLVSSEHTTTKAYVAAQIATLHTLLDEIQGTGYVMTEHSLVALEENIGVILTRMKMNNSKLDRQVILGAINQGRK